MKAKKVILIIEASKTVLVNGAELLENMRAAKYGNKILISFYYIKEEVEFLITSKDFLLVEYEIDTKSLINANKIPTNFNVIYVDFLIDNSGKLYVQGMRCFVEGKALNINVNSEII